MQIKIYQNHPWETESKEIDLDKVVSLRSYPVKLYRRDGQFTAWRKRYQLWYDTEIYNLSPNSFAALKAEFKGRLTRHSTVEEASKYTKWGWRTSEAHDTKYTVKR